MSGATTAPFGGTRSVTSPPMAVRPVLSGLTAQEAFLVGKVQAAGVTDSQILSVKKFHRDEGRSSAFSAALVEHGLAVETEIAAWLGEFHKCRVISNQELVPQPEALRYLSPIIARTRFALPLHKNGELLVAIADPETPQFAQVKHALANQKVAYVIAPASDISNAVEASYIQKIELRDGDNELADFVERLLKEAATTTGVSDIHIIPDDRMIVVKYRVDGVLQQKHAVDGSLREQFSAAIKLSSKRDADGRTRLNGVGGLDTTQRNRPQGTSARRDYGSRQFSLRYSVVPSVHGERIVIRLLDQNAQVGDLATLGMLEDHASIYRKAVRLPYGLILNCGPTGHGKSTTLASAVKYIDIHRKAVLTVEDPVEYRLRGVSQCQVLPDMSFAQALREFLRQNPDVILLGEIRDMETAAIAISISQTGHLLLSTVHANTGVGGLVRLIELGIDPAKLSFSSKLMLSQRLVRRLCPECKRPHSKAEHWTKEYSKLLYLGQAARLLPDGIHFHEAGGGCAACGNSGFKKRIAIFELRPIRPEIQAMLSQAAQGGKFEGEVAERVYADDFAAGKIEARTMEHDGMLKAALGLCSPEEVLAATVAEV